MASDSAREPMPKSLPDSGMAPAWAGNECLTWPFKLDKDGYGAIRHQGVVGGHRFIWTLLFGPIPAGMHVLHKCDNPACINPVHLFLGTHQDNMRDRTQKRRGVIPERWVKLSADAVARIRESTDYYRDVCAREGIGKSQYYRIRNREAWK